MGTYESALSDLAQLEDKKDALPVLARLVTLEPIQANLLRVAELSSELGESKAAAVAFKRVAQLTTAEEGAILRSGTSGHIRKIRPMK